MRNPASMQPRPARYGTRRVIAVDNDPDALELVVTDLEHEGHEVVATAMQGDDVARLCAQFRPDVLVVDYRMPPGLNGIEVAEHVVANAGPPPTIILYTNYRDASIRRRAATLGVTVLPKGNLRGLRRRVSEAPASDAA